MMEMCWIWSQLSLVLAVLIISTKALPMDMDTISKDIQMAAMNGMGIALEAMENAKAGGNFNEEISFGPMSMKKSFGAGAGNIGTGDSADEDRKRRRRSTIEDEEVLPPPNSKEEHRHKRSPCRRRQGQATTVAPANGAGGGGAIPAGGGAASAGGEPVDPNIPRRRRRSPNEDDIDDNINIIPVQRTFGEKTQQINEIFHKIMQNMLDTMAGVFENLKQSIQRASQGQPEIPDGM